MYANGEGVPKDYVKAAAWYRKAANRSDAVASRPAQIQLGQIYEEGGYGLPRDNVQAYKWYDIGAAHTSLDAQNDCATLGITCPAARQRDFLAVRMTQEQINEAQQFAPSSIADAIRAGAPKFGFKPDRKVRQLRAMP